MLILIVGIFFAAAATWMRFNLDIYNDNNIISFQICTEDLVQICKNIHGSIFFVC